MVNANHKDKEYGDCSDSGCVRTWRQRHGEELYKCQGTECTKEKISLELFWMMDLMLMTPEEQKHLAFAIELVWVGFFTVFNLKGK